MQQRLAVVAHGRNADQVHHAPYLLLEQRDLVRFRAVGRRGEEADEAALAGHPASGIEGLHPYVVEVGRTVNRRYRVRLGDDEDGWFARPPADLAGEDRRLRTRPLAAGSKQTQPGARQRDQTVAGRAALEPIVAGAQERELVVRQPREEGTRFARICPRHARHAVAQVRRKLSGARTHLRPVGHGDTDVVEHRDDPRLHFLETRWLGEPIDFDALPGLGIRLDPVFANTAQASAPVALRVKHGVHHQVDRETAAVQDHGERVDEERHVVGDHLDHGARCRPAVALNIGVPDADDRLAVPPLFAELEVTDRRHGERLGARLPHIVLVDAAVVGIDEGHEGLRGQHGPVPSCLLGDRVDQVLPDRRDRSCHRGLRVVSMGAGRAIIPSATRIRVRARRRAP